MTKGADIYSAWNHPATKCLYVEGVPTFRINRRLCAEIKRNALLAIPGV
jgi:hypothetical protein